MSVLLEQFRALKVRFDAAHELGMAALAAHDYEAFQRAVDLESEIVKEQGRLIDIQRAAPLPAALPPDKP